MERIGLEMARIAQQVGIRRMNLPKERNQESGASDTRAGTHGLERAFEEHWASIYQLLVRMVGDPSEAEDLALETFYRLYRR